MHASLIPDFLRSMDNGNSHNWKQTAVESNIYWLSRLRHLGSGFHTTLMLPSLRFLVFCGFFQGWSLYRFFRIEWHIWQVNPPIRLLSYHYHLTVDKSYYPFLTPAPNGRYSVKKIANYKRHWLGCFIQAYMYCRMFESRLQHLYTSYCFHSVW